MLTELAVRNFAVIEETRLALGAGLNVVTGETGAGKSLLVDALSFVLGGPVDRGVIRAGAATASVDAVFRLPPSLTELRAALAELGHEPDEDGTLVLSRETHREGNTVSRLNGRAVPVRVAREVGERLVDIHGQGQHLALFDSGFQLAVLDAFGGLQAKRDAVARAVAEVRRVEAEMSRLMSDAHRVAERSDLLRFQAGEIRAADLKPGEEAAITEERDVLANAPSRPRGLRGRVRAPVRRGEQCKRPAGAGGAGVAASAWSVADPCAEHRRAGAIGCSDRGRGAGDTRVRGEFGERPGPARRDRGPLGTGAPPEAQVRRRRGSGVGVRRGRRAPTRGGGARGRPAHRARGRARRGPPPCGRAGLGALAATPRRRGGARRRNRRAAGGP